MKPLCVLFALAPLVTADDQYSDLRRRMVREQIRGRGVSNAEVLRVMEETPRHLFVPPSVRSSAYADYPLPIGHGATISQPYVVALMTELLEPAPTDRVLEIGTGSGYQAAILAKLVTHVYSIEIVPELARSAAGTLEQLGYSNVTVREGDGYKGWPEHAPYNRIILTAAPPELPQTLVDQLAKGGRLVAPVGRGFLQQLVVVDKAADGTVRRRNKHGVAFVPMRRGPQ
jgi:protein-L-isoaspartate(D-aspartate) O-methyltransferase